MIKEDEKFSGQNLVDKWKIPTIQLSYPGCCGGQIMHGFVVHFYPEPGKPMHYVTAKQATVAIEYLLAKYPTRGVTLAITQDRGQETLWGPALEKSGFKTVQKFFNTTSYGLTLRIHVRKESK